MVDIKTYLEGDIMTKVDRATMRVALEGREPFLDHHLIEFALSLPDDLKIKNGQGKYLLRKLLYQYVPRELIDRPKQGFAVPIEKWLRGVLSDQLRAIPGDAGFFATFELDAAETSRLIDHFLSRKGYVNGYYIWFMYVLYAWWLRWGE